MYGLTRRRRKESAAALLHCLENNISDFAVGSSPWFKDDLALADGSDWADVPAEKTADALIFIA